MIFTVTVTPYRVAFVDEDTMGWFIIDLTVDGLFFLDVIVNLFSAYYTQDEVLVFSKRGILCNYLKF